MTEQEIISACKKQDPNGQKAMVHQYSSMLMAIAFRYSISEQISKDILQDTFIQVFRKIHLYNEKKGAFKAWLKSVTIRIILMHLRKEKSLLNQNNAYKDFVLRNEPIAFINTDLEHQDLFQLIVSLPDSQRIVFNLSVIEGYNHKEIAKELDIKESYSRTLLTRARSTLKKTLLLMEFAKI